MARNKQNIILNNLEIVDIAAEGKAIAKVDGKVVFVPYAIPGSIVDVQIMRKRRNFMEGKVVKVVKQAEQYLEPFCEHFGVCGGCKWQNLPYETQLFYKQKQVVDQLTHIGKIDLPEINDILASPKTIEYRNKLEYTFSNKRWLTQEEVSSGKTFDNNNALGFHIPKLFDKILDIEHCYLQPEPSNEIRLAVRDFALKHNYDFFDIRANSGFLRNIIIRNTKAGKVMVIVVFFYEDKAKREALLDFIRNKFEQVVSLQYVINSKLNDTIADQEIVLYSGDDHLVEEMDTLKFKIAAKSFYQTNSEQVFHLYKAALDFADITPSQTVYDLYTGTGTIALFLAQQAKKVIGIEYVPEAIADAKYNARINNIDNAEFFVGDMKDVLTNDFFEQHGYADVIVLDPPRAGVHANVVEVIMNAMPDKIVYVSCNPATQARDLSLFAEKYNVEKVQPVDMFPHTHHVENIVLLQKKQIL